MSGFTELILTALLIAVVQNLVITGGYGISESFRMASKPRGLVAVSLMIAFFSVSMSIICIFLERVPAIGSLNQYLHFLVYAAILTVLYLGVCVVFLCIKPARRLLSKVGIAAINTLVMAIPLINYRAGFSVAEAIGAGLGAGIAFAASVTLINYGIKKLRCSDELPRSFSGSPALFIYAALIALGLAALSGRALSI